jgi:ABC-type transport system substrate-binding protein
MQQRPDGSLIYDMDSIEMVLATAYKISEDRQLIEFTLHPNAKFANGDPINAQALKESYAWFLGAKGSGQLRVNGLPSADRIEVVDDLTVRLHLDRPVAWGLIGNALLSSSSFAVQLATKDIPDLCKVSGVKVISYPSARGWWLGMTWRKPARSWLRHRCQRVLR